MAPTFVERTSGREPSGRFGVDLAEFSRTYVLDEMLADGTSHPIRTQDVTARIVLITGTTNPGPSPRPFGAPGGAGSLDRVMPMCDPQFPALFADVPVVRVNNMESYVDDYGGGLPLAVPPIVPGYARYNAVEFDVPFSIRPFAVLPNSYMVQDRGDFYDTDGSRKQLRWYPEHLRYVQTFVDDVDSRVSASAGNAMVFRVPSAAPDPAVPTAPDGAVFTAVPDMIIPDQTYKLRWYQVPLRYLTSSNSYLVRYKGFINQWTFLGKVKGSLLYMGAKVVRSYTPPRFETASATLVVDGFQGMYAGSFFAEPLVDLELNFIFTARRRFAAEAAPGDFSLDPDAIPVAERPNRNWIDGPHNWLPHFNTKRFYYAHASVDPKTTFSRWVPQYLSVPHQILFQDPDVPNVVISI